MRRVLNDFIFKRQQTPQFLNKNAELPFKVHRCNKGLGFAGDCFMLISLINMLFGDNVMRHNWCQQFFSN